MSIRRLLLVVVAACLAARGPARAQGLIFETFSEYLDSLRVQAGIPGLAATIVGTSETLWERAYGMQDVDRRLATRTDTLFHAGGLTQVLTASMVLRCVEERRLSLDDRAGQFKPDSAEPNATLRQLLTHTHGASENPVYAYRPERLEPLALAIRSCTGDSFRETFAGVLQGFAMIDSVPGADVIDLSSPSQGVPDASEREQYAGALQRLATPYAVDQRGRATPSRYSVTTLADGKWVV
jgi:CubicO group peptidase (beta-lactamase class C family)